MKKRTIVCLLICISLLLSLLAGCGNSQTTTSAETGSEQETETSTESTIAEEDESIEPEEVEPSASPAEAETEEPAQDVDADETEAPAEETKSISYPLEPTTLVMWAELDGSMIINEWSELYLLEDVTEKTGITLDITTVSDAVAQEQFNLMIAAEEPYDLVMAPELYYSGGAEAAYNDEVILDLTDLLPDYAPDYLNYVESQNAEVQAAVKSGGKYLSIYSIADNYYCISGCIIRQDWLDDLGLDRPTDLDSLTNVLTAFYNTYSPEYTLFTTDANLTYMSDLFNTYVVGYSQTALPVYVTDGTVYCSYATDEYRSFLEWFADLYSIGIINSDFYSTHPLTIRTASGNNGTGFWSARCETIDEWQLYCEDASILEYCNPQPLEYMTDEDGIFNWGTEETYAEAKTSFSVSAYAQNPEIALQFLNYFFTEEGSTLVNYGVEGYTWEYDDNGEIAWTELITNNPDGLSVQTAVNTYTGTALLSCLQRADRTFSTYSETAQLFLEYCNTNLSSDHAWPSAADLTTAQLSGVSSDITNMLTYISEQVLKYMTCAEGITDESWETFQNTLTQMGLDSVIALYQENYDTYVSQLNS